MKPIKGLIFQKYYNENNINNVPRCEIRGVIDDEIIVLLCTSQKGRQYYKSIDMSDFVYNAKDGIYTLLN